MLVLGLTLRVHIREAAHLMAMDLNGLSDPYVKMYILPDTGKVRDVVNLS